jgi:hypothetical protein
MIQPSRYKKLCSFLVRVGHYVSPNGYNTLCVQPWWVWIHNKLANAEELFRSIDLRIVRTIVPWNFDCVQGWGGQDLLRT